MKETSESGPIDKTSQPKSTVETGWPEPKVKTSQH